MIPVTTHPHTPEIIFQDDYLLVLNKPHDMLCVPGRGTDKQDCLSSRVQKQFPEALIVHRLDMATSGLVMMARDTAMQRQLSQLFAQRQIDKQYQALIAGRLQQTQGEINLPIAADWPNRPRQKVDMQAGKTAITRYQVLDTTADEITRVVLTPLTGRTHQLRVHMLAIGHPILGDNLYAPAAVQQHSARLLLHATRLSFMHPITHAPLTLQCPVPF